MLQQPDRKLSDEEAKKKFLAVIDEAVAVIELLAPHCEFSHDLVETLKLGLENAGQLNILMHLAAQKGR